MYAFLFVLVPLATVVAWALARDRKRRHAHGQTCSRGPGLPGSPRKSGPPSGCYAHHSRWQGGRSGAFADAWPNGTSLTPEGGLASQPCQAAGSGRFAVSSRIWVAALGAAALAASCICGCGGGPDPGPAPARPPVPAASAGGVCTPSACISLSRLARSIDSQLRETPSAMSRSLVSRTSFPPALPARPRTRRSSPWDPMSW
jgi:hypothetical protein